MVQLIITYEKATLKVISAIQINTIITDANILKDSKYEILITSNLKCIRQVGQEMYLVK